MLGLLGSAQPTFSSLFPLTLSSFLGAREQRTGHESIMSALVKLFPPHGEGKQ
jgi:hypothetical protein